MSVSKTIIIFLATVFLFTSVSYAQTDNASSDGKPKQTLKSQRKKRKEAKRKWKEARRLKRDEQRAIKQHHKRIQSKDVRKRMKQSKSKAIRHNENKREFFLKRWFTRKK